MPQLEGWIPKAVSTRAINRRKCHDDDHHHRDDRTRAIGMGSIVMVFLRQAGTPKKGVSTRNNQKRIFQYIPKRLEITCSPLSRFHSFSVFVCVRVPPHLLEWTGRWAESPQCSPGSIHDNVSPTTVKSRSHLIWVFCWSFVCLQ
jgi:hypothetical protein